MRNAPLALTIGGLAVLVVALLVGRNSLVPEPREAARDEPVEASASPTQPELPAPSSGPVRPVAPNVVALPEVEPEELVRVDPRDPLSPFGQPLPPPRPDNSRIYRPVADAAGRILGQGLLVDVAGVDIIEIEEVCIDPDGFEWPCGMLARTAFRGLLRGRAVACDIPPEYEGTRITTGCSLGRLDLGEWIVAQGWGRATPGGPYEEQERAAREAEKGIFGPAPTPAPVFTVPLSEALNDDDLGSQFTR